MSTVCASSELGELACGELGGLVVFIGLCTCGVHSINVIILSIFYHVTTLCEGEPDGGLAQTRITNRKTVVAPGKGKERKNVAVRRDVFLTSLCDVF